MTEPKLYISHQSALHYWRTNPPRYVLEGEDRNIRSLRNCPTSSEQVRSFRLSEAEFGKRPIDVLVPKTGTRPSADLKYHIQKAPVPPRSMIPLYNGIHVVSPTLCLVQLCKSLSLAEAVELGMEFCGTYALRPNYPGDKATRDFQLISAASFNRKVKSWKDIHGLSLARKAAAYIVDNSASPMETKVYLLLCLPQKYGGYNIEKPELNAELPLAREEQLILRQDKVKPDLMWRKRRLIVEYDGEYHNDPAQARKDEKRRVILEAKGFMVETIKKQHVYDPLAFASFAEMIAKKCGQRVRPLTLKQQFARESLREKLLFGE